MIVIEFIVGVVGGALILLVGNEGIRRLTGRGLDDHIGLWMAEWAGGLNAMSKIWEYDETEEDTYLKVRLGDYVSWYRGPYLVKKEYDPDRKIFPHVEDGITAAVFGKADANGRYPREDGYDV